MDLPEALELLKVEPTVDKASLRRAYMRAVRAHPPERDPAGFRRVRDAYELAHAVLDEGMPLLRTNDGGQARLEKSVVLAVDIPRVVVIPTSPTERVLALGDQSDEAELLKLTGDLTSSSPLPTQALDQIWLRLSSDHARANFERALRSVGESERLTAIRLLLQHDSDHVTEDELAAAEASRDSHLHFLACVQAWKRRDLGRTSRLLLKLYEAEAISRITVPTSSWCIDVILECLARGRVKSAKRLLNAFERWSRGPEAELAQVRVVAAPLALIQELMLLQRFVPKTLVKSIAEAMAQGDLTYADREVVAVCRALGQRSLSKFAERAPSLYRSYWGVIGPLRRPTRVRYTKSQQFFISVFVVPIVSVIWIASRSCNEPSLYDETSRATQRSASNPGESRALSPGSASGYLASIDTLTPLRAAAQSVIETAHSLGHVELESSAVVFRDSLRESDCLKLKLGFSRVDDLAQALMGASPDLQQKLELLSRSLDERCTAKPSEGREH